MDELIVITAEEAGERLDKILAKRFKDKQSRTYFEYLIAEGKVSLNGQAIKKSAKPKEGDEVEIHFILTPELDLQPENIPLDIVYEDEYLLVINKPAGMVIHPAAGNWTGTFVNALLYYCQHLSDAIPDTLRPGIVHRLDKETSGLLVAAKDSRTQQLLIELFASRAIYKEYYAICVGNPGSGEIAEPIGRHPVKRKQMSVVQGGKPSLTLCKTVKTDGQLSLVELVLATGRTHQIRVHLSFRGTPVLGDSLYGSASKNTKYGVDRQLLHAHQLRFVHPITKQQLELFSPLPADMQRFIRAMR